MSLQGKLAAGVAWLCLIAVGILAYLPGLPGSFLFDDLGSIVGNQALHLHGLTADSLYAAALSSPGTGGLLRPISMLSFALDGYFFGLNPLPFKLTNILIHAACGAILWFVVRELLRAYSTVARRPLKNETIERISFAATAIWLVHPLNLTSVLYTVQRETALSACFTAGAVLSYLVGRRRERDGTSGRALIWLWTPALTALGLLCKETAALLPVYLLTAEATLLRFRGGDGAPSRNALGFQAIFLGIPALAAAVWMARLPAGPGSLYTTRDFTLYERLLTESRVVLDYLRWTFIPDIQQLALYHDDLQTSSGLLQPATTLGSVLAVFFLIAAALYLRKRAPLLSFAVLWFFGGQLLESTILPLEPMFEHRNYLPIFGLIVGTTATLWLFVEPYAGLRGVKAATLGCVLLLGCTTALRSWEWHSELTFARYETTHHPRSARALGELGWSYVAYMRVTRDYSAVPYAVAAELQEKALDPLTIGPDLGIADIYVTAGDLSKTKQYLHAAAADASTAEPSASFQYALQTLLVWDTSKDAELRADIDSVFMNAANNPKVTRDSCYLASVINTYGALQEKNEQIPTAAAQYHKAAGLCPKSALVHINLARLLLEYRDPKDAKREIDAARQLHDIHYIRQLQQLEQALDEETTAQAGDKGSQQKKPVTPPHSH